MNVAGALGINGNLAALIFFLCLGAGATIIKVARMDTRQEMHADHFDVLDKTHTESLRQSSKALEQSAYTKGSIDTLFLLLGDSFKEMINGSGLDHGDVSENSSESSEPSSGS